jgi:general secretion pathway protein L
MTEYIGIEIGRRGMKLAVVEAGKTQAVVTEKRSIAFEEPFSIEIIGNSLEQLLSEIKISSSSPAVISITPLMTSCRIIELPFSSENRIRQVIDFEMESLVPLQTEQIQTSFVKLASLSSGSSSSVFACCADSSEIDAITGIAGKAGLETVALSVSGYASEAYYASCCHAAGSDSSERKGRVYADIGEDCVTYVIISGNEVVFARSVAHAWGKKPDPARIADETSRTVIYYSDFYDPAFEICEFSYSFSDSCSYSGLSLDSGIVQSQEPDSVQDTDSDAGSGPISDLDFDSESDSGSEQAVIGEYSENIGQKWKEKLENSFRSKGFSCQISEVSCFNSIKDVRNAFSAAALYASGKGFLNFVSAGFFRAGFLKNLKKNWTGSFVMAGCVLLSAMLYLGVSEYSSWKKLKHLDDEIRTVFMETFPDVKKIVDPYQQMTVKVNSLIQNQGADVEKGRVIDILREISSRIGPETDITITTFTVLPDEIQINGEAQSFDLAETARKTLDESAMFKDVKVDSVNSDTKAGKIVFRLNLKREGQG